MFKGVPLCALGKSGHWVLGPLHIFTASGRWFNEQTGRRGRLKGQSVSRIIEHEYYQQLCPEAAVASRHMEMMYREYDDFMARAAQKVEQYERFMRDASSGAQNLKSLNKAVRR